MVSARPSQATRPRRRDGIRPLKASANRVPSPSGPLAGVDDVAGAGIAVAGLPTSAGIDIGRRIIGEAFEGAGDENDGVVAGDDGAAAAARVLVAGSPAAGSSS